MPYQNGKALLSVSLHVVATAVSDQRLFLVLWIKSVNPTCIDVTRQKMPSEVSYSNFRQSKKIDKKNLKFLNNFYAKSS